MYAVPTGVDSNSQPVPFSKILGNTHRALVRIQIESPDGTVLAQSISPTDGEVRVDRSAAVRRSCSFDVAPSERDASTGMLAPLIPATKDAALAPFGNLARVYFGVAAPALAETYWWSQGLFRTSVNDIEDDGSPTMKVTGYDLSRTISRNKLTQPWIVAAGTNYGTAIIALATDRYPYLKARAHSISATTGATIVLDPEQDPWDVITQWATAAGCSAYFDTDGYLTLVADADPATADIAWTYQDAGDQRNALLLSAGRSLSDEPGYNGVILTAESATLPAPLRSEVWDTDPSSPTYAAGSYGRVPKFVSNPYVATQVQADAAARAELLRIAGGTEQITVAVVPNPAHEAGDVLRVVRPASGINQTTILESFTMPFRASETMQLSFRERRVTA